MMKNQKEKIKFVKSIVAFGENHLNLDFAGSFSTFSRKNPTANWLYVAHRDQLKSALDMNDPYLFSWNRGSLRRKENACIKKNLDTYLFQAEAHGGGNCPITPAMLESQQARQCYVVLHEAWHSTLHIENIRIPYPLEEASGRVIGIMGAVEFAKKTKDPGLILEASQQAVAWSTFANFINKYYKKLEAAYKKKSSKALRREILKKANQEARKLSHKVHTAWESEEFSRPINNAILIRYYDYTRYYPLMLEFYDPSKPLLTTMKRLKKIGQNAVLNEIRSML